MRKSSEAGPTGGICSVTYPAGPESWSELGCDPCCVNGEGSRIKLLIDFFSCIQLHYAFKAFVEVTDMQMILRLFSRFHAQRS